MAAESLPLQPLGSGSCSVQGMPFVKLGF